MFPRTMTNNTNLPKRKPTRLKGYDYSAPGMYFLTICAKDRKQLLGEIVWCGAFDTPQMILSKYGTILDIIEFYVRHCYEQGKCVPFCNYLGYLKTLLEKPIEKVQQKVGIFWILW